MAQNPDVIGREVLPIPDRPTEGKVALDARDAEFPPIAPLRPPEGAPNVVLVLLDDMGFGAPSVTGGPREMPAMQRIADDGLLYNRFHTTALCSPTRVAMLTGRNHHSAGIGSVAEVATGAPGNDSVRPNTVAPAHVRAPGAMDRPDMATGRDRVERILGCGDDARQSTEHRNGRTAPAPAGRTTCEPERQPADL